MTTQVAEVMLPGQSHEHAAEVHYYESAMGRCNECEAWVSVEEISQENFYDKSGLIEAISERGPYRVGEGEIERVAVSVVSEYYGYACPGYDCTGFIPADDTEHESGYRCPECGEGGWEDPHSALLCCSSCGGPNDLCVAGVNRAFVDQPGVWGCYCHSDCAFYVCTVCHEHTSSPTDHRCAGGDTGSVTPVDVGKPESLPDAIEYVEEVGHTGCAICASEFCCTVHGKHVSPHRGVCPSV